MSKRIYNGELLRAKPSSADAGSMLGPVLVAMGPSLVEAVTEIATTVAQTRQQTEALREAHHAEIRKMELQAHDAAHARVQETERQRNAVDSYTALLKHAMEHGTHAQFEALRNDMRESLKF